jgi:hypothetical protein
MDDRELWLAIRHALLIVVGAIEKQLGIKPSTKELRDKAKTG